MMALLLLPVTAHTGSPCTDKGCCVRLYQRRRGADKGGELQVLVLLLYPCQEGSILDFSLRELGKILEPQNDPTFQGTDLYLTTGAKFFELST